MSMILCCECGCLCDSDQYPEGFYRGEDDEPGDEYYCASCNERDWQTMTDNPTTIPLERCPFCGGDAQLFEWHTHDRDGWCAGCGNEPCLMVVRSDDDIENPTKEEATRRWNTRAEPATVRPTELIARINKSLDYFEVEFPPNTAKNIKIWAEPVSYHCGGVSPNDLVAIRNALAIPLEDLKRVHEALNYATKHRYGDGDVTRFMENALAILDAIIAKQERKDGYVEK